MGKSEAMKKATKKAVAKVAIFVFLIVVLTFATLFTAEIQAFAEGDLEHSLTVDSDWKYEFYDFEPTFSVGTFYGKNAARYALLGGKEEEYSVTATMTSENLGLADNEYELSLFYFTEQRSETPNELTAYYSEDGNRFFKAGTLSCAGNGSGEKIWTQGKLSFSGKPNYLRFEFTVYYCDSDEDKGLYLSLDDIELTAISTTTGASFDASVAGEYFYTGKEITPVINVTTDFDGYYYYKVESFKDGKLATIADAGDYELKITYFNKANKVLETQTKNLTVKPETLTLEGSSLEYLANEKYVVVTNCLFTDGKGRTVDISETGADKTLVIDSDGYAAISVPAGNFKKYEYKFVAENKSENSYLVYVEDGAHTEIYDGEEKTALKYVRFFDSYDPETKTYGYTSNSVSVEYEDENGNKNKPLDVGEYTFTFAYGGKKITGAMTIEPITLTHGTITNISEFSKNYDGTDAVYLDSGVLPEASLVGAIDDIGMEFERLRYLKTSGRSKVAPVNAKLTGDAAKNYVIADEFRFENAAKIGATRLIWYDKRDSANDVLALSDKVYDGTNSVAILNEGNGALSMYGLGEYKVSYSDVGASIKDVNCGKREVEFTLTNYRLYGMYLPNVISELNASINVLPCELKAKPAAYTGENKVFDGTVASSVEITALTFENVPDNGDGLETYLSYKNYSIRYESAEYDYADAGERAITIKNVALYDANAESDKVLRNYVIPTVTVPGGIEAAQIEILSESFTVFEGEALPEPQTDSAVSGIFKMSIFGTRSDAENGVNALDAATLVKGDYFVRAQCTDDNYKLKSGEYKIIELKVNKVGDKEAQYVEIGNTEISLTEANRVLVGGELYIGAYSRKENGAKIDLPIVYRIVSGNCSVDKNGKITVTSAGSFVIGVTCEGGEKFDAATERTIEFLASEGELTATALTDKYKIGENLPDVNGKSRVYYGSDEVTASFAAPEGKIAYGANRYEYYVTVSDKIIGTYKVKVSITGERYKVNVYLGGSVKTVYGASVDLTEFISYIDAETAAVRYEDAVKTLKGYLQILKKNAAGEYEAVNVRALEPGMFYIYGEADNEYVLTLTDDYVKGGEYEISVFGSASLIVEKSLVTVSVKSVRKPYYVEVPSNEELRQGLLLKGEIDSEAATKILAFTKIRTNVSRYSSVGDYAIEVELGDIGDLDKYYQVEVSGGYVSVTALKVSISVTNKKTLYGEPLGEFIVSANIDEAGLEASVKSALEKEIAALVVAETTAKQGSDAGRYPITFELKQEYEGFDTTYLDSYFVISNAKLSGFYFENEDVLYDEAGHTITVKYDETVWKNVTVKYNAGYFSQPGKYYYQATVSKKNYDDLVLDAVLTIGTLNVKSSSLNENRVSVTFSEKEYEFGLDPEYTVLLRTEEASDGMKEDVAALATDKSKRFVIGAVYKVVLIGGGSERTLGYDPYGYKIVFSPAAISYSDKLRLYAYEEGELKEVEFSYKDGEYTVYTNCLEGLIFAEEQKVVVDKATKISSYIIIAGVVFVILLVLSTIFGIGKRTRKARARSRKRHHRWA